MLIDSQMSCIKISVVLKSISSFVEFATVTKAQKAVKRFCLLTGRVYKMIEKIKIYSAQMTSVRKATLLASRY